MKRIIALAALLVLTPQARAESRSVLVVVTHDKDGKAKVTVYSDDEQDRRKTATVGEACKAIAGMKGWGSAVGVFVVTDQILGRKDRKALFNAIDGNAWLDLSYYGREVPKNLTDHFLKPVPAKKNPPNAEPRTGVIDQDHAVRIALAHLNIDKLTSEPGPAFNLRVAEDKLNRADLKELDGLRHGVTKHKDLAGLPDTTPVFSVTIQHGLAGDSIVHVAKESGRVILVKFVPEG